MPLQKWKKPSLIALALALLLVFGIGLGFLTRHVFSADSRFEDFAEELFRQELTGSTLNLHYTLADPKKCGLDQQTITLGRVSSQNMDPLYEQYQEYEETLKGFPYSKLSKENQLTLDTLLLYFHTQLSLGSNYMLEEVLSPSLGTQAQLPVLLAEYPFYTEEDITDYLKLLTCVRSYFESILVFEQEKARLGFFMSDTSLDRVLAQCQSFIQDPSSNYLTQIFEEKLKDFPTLSQEEVNACLTQHQKILETSVIPAYVRLMEGLEALRGSGRNNNGLAYFKGGQEYYEYLLHSQVGTFVPVEQMEKRLYSQLASDSKEISQLLRANPKLLSELTQGVEFRMASPEETLAQLKTLAEEDFPSLPEIPYQVKEVHSSMEKFLSPAFYLTPPIDTHLPNVIYINRGNPTTDLELFATLAHEGFPGHLYQTQYFSRSNPSHIRQLLTSGGYIEGWATYIESFAYGYAPVEPEVSRAIWLNRSVNLCLYSLLDIGIHYRGWNLAAVTKYLNTFGITDRTVIGEIFQYIVETPANYLRYYWGYLSFLDLQVNTRKEKGDSFDLKKFHKKVLEIGPVPFPILEKYLDTHA